VVHRDVKPANVLLEGDWAWLADFGIATIAHGDASAYEGTLTGGGAIGTPEYMAPEQVVPNPARPLDGRADHYAFGVVLYELLTGRVPFKGQTTWETCYQVMQAPLPRPRELNPNIPEAVENVLVRALARDRDDRYASGLDLVAALGAAVGASAGPPVGAPTGPGQGAPATPSQDPPVKVRDESVEDRTGAEWRSATRSAVAGTGDTHGPRRAARLRRL
jgi:serine/threonine-protein kinase